MGFAVYRPSYIDKRFLLQKLREIILSVKMNENEKELAKKYLKKREPIYYLFIYSKFYKRIKDLIKKQFKNYFISTYVCTLQQNVVEIKKRLYEHVIKGIGENISVEVPIILDAIFDKTKIEEVIGEYYISKKTKDKLKNSCYHIILCIGKDKDQLYSTKWDSAFKINNNQLFTLALLESSPHTKLNITYKEKSREVDINAKILEKYANIVKIDLFPKELEELRLRTFRKYLNRKIKEILTSNVSA